MAKPLNLNDDSCDPISSNCITWQGPDIECINLCKGDKVTHVIYKLAQELCTVIDILDISNYDLSCFNIEGCAPEDFKAFINLLIERICDLEGVDTSTGTTESGCPDCTVTIAQCFYYQNAQGDTETTMQLIDYVTAMGNRICDLVQQINTINLTLTDHEERITDLETQESQGETQMFEMVTSRYLLPDQTITAGTLGLEQESRFQALEGATGLPNEIYANLTKATTGLTNLPQLAGNGNMGSIEGWTTEVLNEAQSVGNIWLTLSDMRAALQNVIARLPSTCDGVKVTLTAEMVDANTVKLFYTGSIEEGFVECALSGTRTTITDSNGGSITIDVPVLANFNQASGYTVDLTGTPVNGTADLTIVSDLCMRESSTDTECKCKLEYYLNNVVACPTLSLAPGETTIGYDFTHLGQEVDFTIELYDGTGSSLLQQQVVQVTGPQTVAGLFQGLNSDTAYRVRIRMTIGANVTECPFVAVSTTPPACLPPNNVGATIIQ